MQAGRQAIGVDLGGTKIEVAAVREDGRVLASERGQTDKGRGADAVIEQIGAFAREVQARAGPAIALGIGVPGQVDPAGGTVRFAPNLDWHDVPVRAPLSQTLGLPVVVANDVRVETWGECLFGAGRGTADLVCVFVGTGIGGGVVAGGRLLAGCTNAAGELGHVTVQLDGPPCHCGNRGCIEALAGGWAIARSARAAVAADPARGKRLLELAEGRQGSIDGATVARAAHEGDALARELADGVARALGAAAVGLVNAFNPCRLILGGGVVEGMPELVGAVEATVRERALPSARAVQVLRAELRRDAGVIGAAALALELVAEGREP